MFSWITGGLGIALLVALTIIGLMYNSIQSLNQEIGKANVAVDQANEVNESNRLEVSSLRKAIRACVDERRLDEQANTETVERLMARYKKLESEKQVERVVREEVFRDPSCKELGAIDIFDACPSLAAVMRKSANSLDQVRDGGGAGAGASAPPLIVLR